MIEKEKTPPRVDQDYEVLKFKMMEAAKAELIILDTKLKQALADNDDENIARYSEALATIKQRAVGNAQSVVNASRMSMVSSGLATLMKGISAGGDGDAEEEEAGRHLADLRKKMVGRGVGGGKGIPKESMSKDPGPADSDEE